jgi:hypothetical protein
VSRKKTVKSADAMATVTVLISFNGLYRGDVVRTEYDAKVQGWERAGLIRSELDDAASEAGPGSAEPDDSGSVAQRTGDSGQGGHEPGQGFGSGGYGAAAGVDQD